MKKIKLLLAGIAALCLTHSQTQAQCGPFITESSCTNCVTVSLPTGASGCAGSPYVFTPSITLPPGYSILNYIWSPGAGAVPSSGTGMPGSTSLSPVPTGTYIPCSNVPTTFALNVAALAPSVIANGNFSSGATQYCTNYQNVVPSSLTNGRGTVTNNAQFIPGFGSAPFYDHTTGTPAGSMYIVNSSANVNLPWQQNVNLCAGLKYNFSFWAATLHNSLHIASFYVQIINGAGSTTMYGPFTTSSAGLDVWKNFSFTFNNPSGAAYTTANISIVFATGYSPNTIVALDDISMNRICQVTTPMTLNIKYGSISGPTTVCAGSTIILAGCTPGGTWSSSNSAVAAVNTAGVVTGVAGGTATITYIETSGCSATSTITVPIINITGSSSVCMGSNITLTAATGPGYWTCGSGLTNLSGTGSVGSAGFLATAPGTWNVTFTDFATRCTKVIPIVVNSLPVITGTPDMCVGVNTYWTSSMSGYWTCTGPITNYSGSPSATGGFQASASGSGSITVTAATTGCSATLPITINVTPTATSYVYLCVGSTTMLSASPAGGTWSTTSAIAIVDAATGVTGASSMGAASIITYTLPTGCRTYSTVHPVDCSDTGGILGGISTVCQGQSFALSTAIGIPTGGIWSSSNTAVGIIDASTGYFNAVGGGTTTVIYTVGSTTHSFTITVIAAASACVTSSLSTYWNYTFTSTCSSTSIIHCQMAGVDSTPLGTVFTVAPGTYASGPLATASGATGAPRVCVIGVTCDGCYTSVLCCAAINFLKPANGEENNTIAETSGNTQFSIAPNPSNGSFVLSGNIANTTEKSVDFQITDMLGKTAYSDVAEVENGAITENISLDSKLPNGIYFIKIKDEAGSQMIRFVLSR